MKKMGTGDQDKLRTSSVCRWWSMSKSLSRWVVVACTVCAALFLAAALLAQTGGTQQQTPPPPPDQKQDQNIPDAPSAVQPPKPAPETAPPQEPAPQDQPAPTPPSSEPPPQNAAPATNEPPPQNAAPDTSPNPVQKPPINIRTVPEGGATKNTGDQEDFFKITVQANQVMVPVTVKDDSGRLVSGLLAKDFNVLENGKKQKLNFFTSDPFAISAAVI